MASSSTVSTRPLRVLCCSGSLEGGGSERQLWQLASQLNRVQFAPSVYLLYRRGHYLEQLPEDVSVTAFWSEFDESQRYWPGQIRSLQIRHLASVVRKLKIDVIYDRTFHMTLITASAARRVGVPRVSVIVSPPSADFQKSRERFRFFKKRLLAAAYRQEGCVTLAVSDEVADDAAAFYRVNRNLIRVLPNPVDLESVQAAALHTNLRCTPLESGLRIVVVGRLSREKGQRLALEALKIANTQALHPMHMDIVGDGPDRADLEQLASRLGICDHVTFHGFASNPYPMIRNSHLLCIPSEYEGLPNVALEAMALGTLVVATNCSGSLRSLIGNDERGRLVSRDVQTLAEAFAQEAGGGPESERRRKLAAKWVAEHHALPTWLQTMSTTLSNVSRIAARHNS
jgi:glycosyltransferase involved in cell wall biosynthesis